MYDFTKQLLWNFGNMNTFDYNQAFTNESILKLKGLNNK